MRAIELREILLPFHAEVMEVTMPVGHDPFFENVARTYVLQKDSFRSIDDIVRKFSNCNILFADCEDELNQDREIYKYVVRYHISGPNMRIAGDRPLLQIEESRHYREQT